MNLSSWLQTSGRALGPRLERLRLALDALLDSLREDVALAVGRAVAESFREGLRRLLGCEGVFEEPSRYGGWHPPRANAPPTHRPGDPGALGGWRPQGSAPLWGERHENDYERWREEEEQDLDDDRPFRSQQMPPSPRSSVRERWWAPALAVGCQTAAWWLHRRPGRLALLAALGLGAASTLGAGIALRLAVPAAGLVGSVLGLLALGDLLLALIRLLC